MLCCLFPPTPSVPLGTSVGWQVFPTPATVWCARSNSQLCLLFTFRTLPTSSSFDCRRTRRRWSRCWRSVLRGNAFASPNFHCSRLLRYQRSPYDCAALLGCCDAPFCCHCGGCECSSSTASTFVPRSRRRLCCLRQPCVPVRVAYCFVCCAHWAWVDAVARLRRPLLRNSSRRMMHAPPHALHCVCVPTLCMGHCVPVLPHGRPPGLHRVPVRWAFAVLWVCGVVGRLVPAAAGGRDSVLPGSPAEPPRTPVGLHAVCFAPYLRLRLGTAWLCALGRCRCCGCCNWPCAPVFPLARWLQDPPVLEPVLEVHAARERVFFRAAARALCALRASP